MSFLSGILVRDAPPAPAVTTPALSPAQLRENKGPQLAAVSVVFVVVAVIFVALRTWVRQKKRVLGADDMFILVAGVASIIQSAAICKSVSLGFGKHMKAQNQDTLKTTLMWFWIAQLAYKSVTWPTKASFLLLYKRIFDVQGSRAWGISFRFLVYAMLAIILFFWFACTVVSVFACVPVARNWNKKIPGGCVNNTPWWFAYAAINISTDLIIFILPLPLIKALKVPLRAKFALGAIFGIGLFVCVTTVVRMTTLNTTSKAPDVTYDGVTTLMWTVVETNVGIICACLPILRPLVSKAFPKWLGKSSGGFTSFDNQRATESKKSGYGSNAFKSNNWSTSDESNFVMASIPGRKSHPVQTSNSQEHIIETNQDGIVKNTDIQISFEGSDQSPQQAQALKHQKAFQ